MKVLMKGGPKNGTVFEVRGHPDNLRVEHDGAIFLVPIYVSARGGYVAVWKEGRMK